MNTLTSPFIRGTMLSLVLVLGLYCGLASARDEACVYDQKDWKGDRFCTSESIRNLANEDWDDDIASIDVNKGIEVILYEDRNFQGRSLRMTEDADHIRHGLDHEVSSLEIIRLGHDNHHQSSSDKSHVRYPASEGWKLQEYCNCLTNKHCYVRHSGSKREVASAYSIVQGGTSNAPLKTVSNRMVVYGCFPGRCRVSRISDPPLVAEFQLMGGKVGRAVTIAISSDSSALPPYLPDIFSAVS